ncbi:hypothetical protein HNQ80_001293 [Anaerosolibacter carboniphilus]|uniref:Copper amine oxidase-like N-terminal domain-containing protein n=1 Tax=Anaerosolibacter carboniphilus TaxID=1417629 RepID=A0A841KN22_9FIRM|nr:copper amine oxidase N-terminal domain-containing protein [Anaerosolibacter carboniphilus]MBB6215204.1 hypothetical protein [Anaerosolibacter carboniphilus]
MKKIVAIVLASSIAFSGASMVYANNVENKGETEKIIPISAPIKAMTPKSIFVGGKKIDLKDTMIYEKDGHTMIPLRWTLEALDYKVEWNDKLKKIDIQEGAKWTSISIGKDSYFFAKVAPMSLGIAPEIKEDRAYVSLTFLEEVLKVEYSVQGDNIIVQNANPTTHIDEANEKVDMKAVIKKVTYDDELKLKEIIVENVDQDSGTYDTAVVLIHEKTQMMKGNHGITTLEPGEKVELTFEEGPITMIYPVRIGAKVIRVVE